MRPHILIVEDEEQLARLLQLELQYEQYETTILHNGKRALEEIQTNKWDLILLDIMLPGASGLEVLRHLRKRGDQTPVILLTARDQVWDKVSGLDLGANDYVTKPFNSEELLARIRVHLRTHSNEHTTRQTFTMKDLVVDPLAREVMRGDEQIVLTAKEFDLLCYLLRNRNVVLTREQIIEHVWGYTYTGDTNVVDVYIRYIRQKIDRPDAPSYIETVRGVGYVMKD